MFLAVGRLVSVESVFLRRSDIALCVCAAFGHSPANLFDYIFN
jgi:hypothetical protein